ncbi:MAG: hypothetical protein IJQ47_10080, partial [Synergistaceae bacterium]|nr:hypothetical protein [Synergistaceae bacterium]
SRFSENCVLSYSNLIHADHSDSNNQKFLPVKAGNNVVFSLPCINGDLKNFSLCRGFYFFNFNLNGTFSRTRNIIPNEICTLSLYFYSVILLHLLKEVILRF